MSDTPKEGVGVGGLIAVGLGIALLANIFGWGPWGDDDGPPRPAVSFIAPRPTFVNEHAGQHRVYVCERGRWVEAWIDGVGINEMRPARMSC